MNRTRALRDALVLDSARQRDALTRQLMGLQSVARTAAPVLRLARFAAKRPVITATVCLVLARLVWCHPWVRGFGGAALLWRALRKFAFK